MSTCQDKWLNTLATVISLACSGRYGPTEMNDSMVEGNLYLLQTLPARYIIRESDSQVVVSSIVVAANDA